MMTKMYTKIEQKNIYKILFITVLTVLSSLIIFHKGIIYGDDINFHIHRILALTDNIKIGKYVPVYFNYLNGLGYANGLFYPDFFLIIPAFLTYLGINIIISLKIFIIIINLTAIYTIYLCIYKISKEKKCAYIGMILYALSNYRFVVFAERGALGEMQAFVFIPLVILGLHEILYENEHKGYILTLGLSSLCFSHVISFYLMIFFTILIILINIKCLKQNKRLKALIIYISLAILITSHFWLPMLEQITKHSFNLSANSKIMQNIMPIYFLFIDFPLLFFKNYLPSGIGLIYYIKINEMLKQSKNNKFLHTLTLLGIITIIIVCLSLIWKIKIFYKLFSIIQFPWRSYTFATVFFIIVFSIVIKAKKSIKICLIYTLIIFIGNTIIHSLDIYITKPIDDEIMLGEYLPKRLDMNYIEEIKNNNIEYIRQENILNISLKKEAETIEVPLIYYEGYKACEKQCYEVYETEKGLVGVKLKKETKNLKIWYSGTKIYKITKYTSIIGIVLLLYKIKKND